MKNKAKIEHLDIALQNNTRLSSMYEHNLKTPEIGAEKYKMIKIFVGEKIDKRENYKQCVAYSLIYSATIVIPGVCTQFQHCKPSRSNSSR